MKWFMVLEVDRATEWARWERRSSPLQGEGEKNTQFGSTKADKEDEENRTRSGRKWQAIQIAHKAAGGAATTASTSTTLSSRSMLGMMVK